jgi:hypothetical protein
MKFEFAIVHGERRKAEPGLSGKCCLYGHAMIARCGEHNVWHWAMWETVSATIGGYLKQNGMPAFDPKRTSAPLGL